MFSPIEDKLCTGKREEKQNQSDVFSDETVFLFCGSADTMRKLVVYFPSFCVGWHKWLCPPISINSFHTSVIYRPLLFQEDKKHQSKVGQPMFTLRKCARGMSSAVTFDGSSPFARMFVLLDDESDIPRGKHRWRATDPLRCRR